MSTDEMKLCVECNAPKSSYKCPRCRALYCSLKCCNAHKAVCVASGVVTDKAFAAASAGVPVRPAGTDSKASIQTKDMSSEFVVLTEDMKNRLRQSTRVRSMLRSKKFQAKVRAVDRAEDRQRELKKARLDPDFDKLIENMLDELGCRKGVNVK
jgi:hypothetical protein